MTKLKLASVVLVWVVIRGHNHSAVKFASRKRLLGLLAVSNCVELNKYLQQKTSVLRIVGLEENFLKLKLCF
jgi:hypothetical protein